MMCIPLTQNQIALIDDADYDRVSMYKWRAQQTSRGQWYARAYLGREGGKAKYIYLHQFILNVTLKPGYEIDHKNRDGLDNRRKNLRIVTRQENTFNRRPRRGYWRMRNGKYRARIEINGKTQHIGNYDTPEEAHAAYLRIKAIRHHIPTRKIAEVCV